MTTALRFGILIEQRDAWPLLVERTRGYEELGFDTVWLADCFADPLDRTRPWYEGWSVLTGLAALTSRIRLGTLITHVIYRNPTLLARQAMTVDHIAGGRLDLGMGTGASEQDWPMTLGVDAWTHAERVGRFGEAVAIVDRLLRGEATSFEGRYYQVKNATLAPLPIQRPRPRLTIAAHGPAMLKHVARYADTWNTAGIYWRLDPTETTAADAFAFTRELSLRLDEEAAVLGRDPGTIARSFLAGWEWPVATAAPWDSVQAFFDFVGRYRELGFTEFICPEPAVEQRAVYERVAGEVLPTLRSGVGG